jgi:hypothetical protein
VSHDGGTSPSDLHLVALVGPVLVFALLAVGADVQAWLARRGLGPAAGPTAAAAVCSVLAGVVHAAVAPEHLAVSPLYGAFFTQAAGAQLAWAALAVLRPRRWVLTAGILGNVGLVALWAWTRAVAVPWGPYAGLRESVGIPDVLTAVLEVALVGCCLRLLVQFGPKSIISAVGGGG